MAAKTRSKSFKPGSFLRVAYSAPPPSEIIEAEIRRFTLPATKALPFVRLSPNDQPMLRPESFWHVRPSGKRERDVQTGRQYAQLAIAAMKADGNRGLIALIIQDIIKAAANPTPKICPRTQSPTLLGFLAEISGSLATARRQSSHFFWSAEISRTALCLSVLKQIWPAATLSRRPSHFARLPPR